MEKETFIIIGLGNPGREYEHTRHNVGFDVIEVLSQKLNLPVNRAKCKGQVGEGSYQGKRLVLCRPQTYMNNSGQCVTELVSWYKAEPDQVLVIYDDIDLPQGSLRVRKSGSAGTHNGMRSIIGLWGRQDFPRIRVGVGAKPQGWDLADWVLSHYKDAAEREIAFKAYVEAADCVLDYVAHGMDHAMQAYNHKETKKTEPKE